MCSFFKAQKQEEEKEDWKIGVNMIYSNFFDE